MPIRHVVQCTADAAQRRQKVKMCQQSGNKQLLLLEEPPWSLFCSLLRGRAHRIRPRLSRPPHPQCVSGGAGLAEGTDKLNSVVLQLIIMPRLSLSDTGDLSGSHADTYISSCSGSACEGHAWQHFPYPALAVDLDVLFTFKDAIRFIFGQFSPFLHSLFFPTSSSSSPSSSYTRPNPLQFISEERL